MASNVEAAASGDRRAALEALRDTLARALDQCEPNMHAQIAGQYRATLAELAELPVAVVPLPGVVTLDGAKARRAARQAAAAVPVSAAGGGKRRR